MKKTQFREHAVKAMIAINAALQNLRLYPPSSNSTINAIHNAYRCILKVLDYEDALIFAESERDLLIGEEFIGENEQKTLMVEAFIDLLINLRIKTITFARGLEQEELTSFLEALAVKPEALSREGGLTEFMAHKGLRHIHLERKTYSVGEKTTEITLREIHRISIEDNFAPMVHALDFILDSSGKEPVSRHIAAALAGMDADFLGMVFTQDIESEMGEKLFRFVLDELDDEKFERLFLEIKKIMDGGESWKERVNPGTPDAIRRIYLNMMDSEVGERLQIRLKAAQAEERLRKENQRESLRAGLNSILRGETGPFRDKELLYRLPHAVAQMLARGNRKAAQTIIDRLGDGLRYKDPTVRANASEAILIILERSSSENRLGMIDRLSDAMTKWVKLEDVYTPGYEKICHYLETLALDCIRRKEFAKYHKILETFHVIHSGKIRKEEETQFFATSALNAISTDDVLNLLLEEFQTNAGQKRPQAIQSLVQLGGSVAGRLMDLLQDTQNKSIRAKIVQILSDIGAPAMPFLAERLQGGGPWYYVRNLVLLLGKIGDESHLKFLKPLLLHDDYRVQREALNSIYAIGGEQRKTILLSVITNVSDRLKIDIIGMLGALKCEEAAPVFLEMLESKMFLNSKHRSELEEKICTVLGTLGFQEAAPVLRSIVDQKRSLIGRRAYSERVQIAADAALALLQEEHTGA